MENRITLEFYQIDIEKTDDNLAFTVEKLGSGIDGIDELRLINVSDTYSITAEISEQEDEYVFNYSLEKFYFSYNDICKQPFETRLKVARNLTHLSSILSKGILPVIHPETIYFDDNFLPKITVRYSSGMRKFEDDKKNFDNDLKMMILSLVYDKYEWEKVYKTNGQVIKEKDISEIYELKTIEEIGEYLTQKLHDEIDVNKNTKSLVDKKKYNIFKISTFVSPIIIVLLVIPLVFYAFFDVPSKNKVINGSTYFLAQDYSNVISNYTSVGINDLERISKYQLAYSYIQLSGLSTSQKTLLLNSLSVRSVDDYFEYWIYYGRNDFENAHEAAITLQDIELRYYAVIGYLNYLQTDTELRGSEKEAKISEYTNLKNTYERELNDLLGGNTDEE